MDRAVAAFVAVVVLVMNGRFESLLFAAPLLVFGLLSFDYALVESACSYAQNPNSMPTQIRFLHRMARKTWGFFDTFITAENHWLPPDNYQEAPIEVLARRTSPTNIGLSLLANLTAYDFGYINMQSVIAAHGEYIANDESSLNAIAVIYITGITLKH